MLVIFEENEVDIMLNMHSNKTKKTISTVIIIVLVLAMVIPTIAAAIGSM